MNRLLLIVHNTVEQDYFRYYNDLIEEQFIKRGIIVDKVDMTESEDKWECYAGRILQGYYDAALVLNSWGEQRITLGSGGNLFDKGRLPFYNWIMDHPAEHNGHMTDCCDDYNVICIDRDHIRFLLDYYPGIKSASFLPLPVRKPDQLEYTFEQYCERRTDVVFAGNCPDIDDMERIFNSLPEAQRDLIFYLSDYLLQNRELTYENALENVLISVFERDISSEEMREYVKLTASTLPYVRARIRDEVIRNVIDSEIRLDLYGKGWEKYKTELSNGNTNLCGTATFFDLPRLFNEAKIVLNIMPWFKNGSHDRIANGVYAGAAIATDESVFLKKMAEENPDKDSFIFFDISRTEEMPDIIERNLLQPERLYMIAENGRRLIENRLSAERLVGKLIQIIERSSGGIEE